MLLLLWISEILKSWLIATIVSVKPINFLTFFFFLFAFFNSFHQLDGWGLLCNAIICLRNINTQFLQKSICGTSTMDERHSTIAILWIVISVLIHSFLSKKKGKKTMKRQIEKGWKMGAKFWFYIIFPHWKFRQTALNLLHTFHFNEFFFAARRKIVENNKPTNTHTIKN